MTSAMPDLVVDNVTVRFGGLLAVDAVSIRAPSGQITGLLGPNGAGKTTTFNACTGLVQATTGSVHLGDHRLDGEAPAKRASRGLGRTFQRMELFDSMSVAENVALGPEAFLSSRRPWSQLVCTPHERREIDRRAGEALERCGIGSLAHRAAGDLSTGQRRLVELARAIASPFTFLLLDEPSSGLDMSETETFGHVLREYVAESGVGILLVEHDMALVTSVCSYIYLLDFGKLIFSGTVEQTLASDVVRAAYLGSDLPGDVGVDEPYLAPARHSAETGVSRV